jgi:hypothetical protein
MKNTLPTVALVAILAVVAGVGLALSWPALPAGAPEPVPTAATPPSAPAAAAEQESPEPAPAPWRDVWEGSAVLGLRGLTVGDTGHTLDFPGGTLELTLDRAGSFEVQLAGRVVAKGAAPLRATLDAGQYQAWALFDGVNETYRAEAGLVA